jgi:hypothetical protein
VPLVLTEPGFGDLGSIRSTITDKYFGLSIEFENNVSYPVVIGLLCQICPARARWDDANRIGEENMLVCPRSPSKTDGTQEAFFSDPVLLAFRSGTCRHYASGPIKLWLGSATPIEIFLFLTHSLQH